jgi:hypothetical protein
MLDNKLTDNNIDFFLELNKELSNNNTDLDNKCLITQTDLQNNFITLSCNHKFNYLALYNELVKQKTRYNSLETTFLKLNEIKCPYCRTINKQLLPFIDISGVNLIRGVNCPKKLCMKLHSCEWKFKNGKNKGSSCNKPAIITELGCLCEKHSKKIFNNQLPIIEDYKNICKHYKISDLKNILKSLNLKCSGNKSELISRLLNVNYQFNTN